MDASFRCSDPPDICGCNNQTSDHRIPRLGRGVVVALTDAGVARRMKIAPMHQRGVSQLFVSRLSDRELALLASALDKVTLDPSFG